MDDALRQTLWDWGRALRAERVARGLGRGDVARLVGLGWDAGVVADVEDGRAGLAAAWEVTVALGLGFEVALVDGAGLGERWRSGLAERERERRAVR